MSASNCPTVSSAILAARPAKVRANANAPAILQLGPVMALVSGPTVGNAISDPENAVAKLVDAVKDNSEVVRQLFLRFLNRPGKPDEVAAAARMFDQLEAEHAKLVADLDAYEKELGPKLAERNSIAKTASPGCKRSSKRTAKSPNSRTAARKRAARPHRQGSGRDRRLRQDNSSRKLPEVGSGAKEERRVGIRSSRSKLVRTYRAKFSRQPDGSIFVEGDKAKGAYRVVAPIPLDKVTGIRLDALADDRLPVGSRPQRRRQFRRHRIRRAVLSRRPAPTKLVSSWDFSGSRKRLAKLRRREVVADSGMRHVFGNGQNAGLKTAVKAPAGLYLLEIVTGIRSAFRSPCSGRRRKRPKFEDARSARRSLPRRQRRRHSRHRSRSTPTAELTGLRIIVDDDRPCCRSMRCDCSRPTTRAAADVKLTNAKATFSQTGYASKTAIDGNSEHRSRQRLGDRPASRPRPRGRFSKLRKPLEGARITCWKSRFIRISKTVQHSLGRFRISVTDAKPPLDFGLPADRSARFSPKPADKRTDAEQQAVLAQHAVASKTTVTESCRANLTAAQQCGRRRPHMKELEDQLAAAQQPLPIDPKLQQMRRAVELSEEQLKNKRLTVAQDVVWALINNPSFLYNH